MLLDTCTFLWLTANQTRLSDAARTLIVENARNLLMSSISAFEIAVKHGKGAIHLPLPPQDWIPAAMRHHGVTEIPVDSQISIRACELPFLHRDPCDWMIIATSQLLNMEILTPDHLISQYPDVKVRW